jgi:uncharacterized membrane protein YhhN
MLPKSALFLRLSFVTVTILELAGETMPNRWLVYTCKPLIMGVLLLYVWQYHQPVIYPTTLRWLVAGMVFALGGDVCLMIQEVDLFAPGLGSFLIMQVCYSIAFWQSIRRSGQPLTESKVWIRAVPFLLYLGVFLVLLRPAFVNNSALLMLWWPVVVYAICLNTMGLLAVWRRGLPSYSQVVIGALLFILSDSVLAVNKFLQPIAGASWFVMSTYAAAQYLIVTGMVQALSTPQESGLSAG